MAGMAVLCSALFTFYCQSVQVNVDMAYPNSNNVQGETLSIELGPWYVRDYTWVDLPINNEKQGGRPYQTKVSQCRAVDDAGISVDAPWKAARALGVLSFLMGAIATIVLGFAPCQVGDYRKANMMMMVVLFVAALLQGLTFVAFNSHLCDESADSNVWLYLNKNTEYGATYESRGCEWNSGSTSNVFAIVLYGAVLAWLALLGPPVTPMEEANRGPPEQHTVTYQRTVDKDGMVSVVQTSVIKGQAVPEAAI